MLRPLIFTEDEIQQVNKSVIKQKLPLKTYQLDIDVGEVYANYTDSTDAIKQTTLKALLTHRDKYLIYSSNYGSELKNLLGKGYSLDYYNLEVPRLVNEALMVYDWFVGTSNYVIDQTGDSLNISFSLQTNVGKDINVGVAI